MQYLKTAATSRCRAPGGASTACDPDAVLSVRGMEVLDNILTDIAGGKDPYAKSDCAGDMKAPGFKVIHMESAPAMFVDTEKVDALMHLKNMHEKCTSCRKCHEYKRQSPKII